jgi:hypothetical protein
VRITRVRIDVVSAERVVDRVSLQIPVQEQAPEHGHDDVGGVGLGVAAQPDGGVPAHVVTDSSFEGLVTGEETLRFCRMVLR